MTIVLVVSPIGKSLFDGEVDGRRIVSGSATPFCDAARAFLASGATPTTKFVMRRTGEAVDSLRSTIGVAAGLTARDSGHGPRFVKYVAPPF